MRRWIQVGSAWLSVDAPTEPTAEQWRKVGRIAEIMVEIVGEDEPNAVHGLTDPEEREAIEGEAAGVEPESKSAVPRNLADVDGKETSRDGGK